MRTRSTVIQGVLVSVLLLMSPAAPCGARELGSLSEHSELLEAFSDNVALSRRIVVLESEKEKWMRRDFQLTNELAALRTRLKKVVSSPAKGVGARQKQDVSLRDDNLLLRRRIAQLEKELFEQRQSCESARQSARDRARADTLELEKLRAECAARPPEASGVHTDSPSSTSEVPVLNTTVLSSLRTPDQGEAIPVEIASSVRLPSAGEPPRNDGNEGSVSAGVERAAPVSDHGRGSPAPACVKARRRFRDGRDDTQRIDAAAWPLAKEASSAHYRAGVLLFKAGRYKEAAEEFEDVIKLIPGHASALYNLGVLHADYLNEPLKALQDYRAYLDTAPRASDAPEVREKVIELELRESTRIGFPLDEAPPKEQRYN